MIITPCAKLKLSFQVSREENIALMEHNFYRSIHKSVPINLTKDLV